MMSRPLNTAFLCQLLLCFVALSGCTAINLMPNYDERTDKLVTALQHKFETFFVRLEDTIGTDAASYEHNKAFYQEIRVDISALELRVNAIPNNTKTQEQVTLLKDNLKLLKAFHQQGLKSTAVIDPPRQLFNMSLQNILRLELAKKRGMTL